jgi:hypothetical protein
VFPQVNFGVVGLAGFEPAASSLSEIDGKIRDRRQALCYLAVPQLALIHEWHWDGVNRGPAALSDRRRLPPGQQPGFMSLTRFSG